MRYKALYSYYKYFIPLHTEHTSRNRLDLEIFKINETRHSLKEMSKTSLHQYDDMITDTAETCHRNSRNLPLKQQKPATVLRQ